MAKVRFTRDFNWMWPQHHGRVSTQYKAGSAYTVKRNCADEAIAKGAAKEVTSRKASAKKASADGESTD